MPPTADGPAVRLTAGGRRVAARRVRSERLWAAFLDEFPDEGGSNAAFELDELDAAIPADVRARLTSQLRAAGRLPDVDDAPLGERGPR
jgi:Mn-dependent DtxR family transcriptional regulator